MSAHAGSAISFSDPVSTRAGSDHQDLDLTVPPGDAVDVPGQHERPSFWRPAEDLQPQPSSSQNWRTAGTCGDDR